MSVDQHTLVTRQQAVIPVIDQRELGNDQYWLLFE